MDGSGPDAMRRAMTRRAWTRRHRVTLAVAIVVILGAGALAVASHTLLRLLTLKIAVARTSTEDRQAATALLQFFAAQHPQVRISPLFEPDRLTAAAALDRGDSQLALLRSDASAQDGQTLVILRRDAVVFVAPGGSHVDSVTKLRGATVGLLDGRKLDARLLDLILKHFGIPPDSVRRELLTVDQLTEAARHRRVDAVFVVAPPASKLWLSLYTALRKGAGQPKTFEVDEAAAIAREHPVLDTIDVPKGTFAGSVPAPSDDITTLSVSHRLIAQSEMPDWLAGEITREVLTGKPRLVALDDDLAGIEAPDTDDKVQALPIHPGAAAYLTGNMPSLSDQAQNAAYWVGLMVSAAASLSAAAAALYQRYRPQEPPGRVMRLLEIWLSVRGADAAALDTLESETDALVAETIRTHAHAHERTESPELRLVTLLVVHVREAIQRRRGQMRETGRA
ncbi:TAXI family TRAP transporter solute-binding subunit [Methylobacterium sp. NEAU 140]|uniref:TAXI family TRAP transporter solute-binding subunit n=1 Tax=Methylobacterium sp. NEAU 140 TaxID=3064945 RepID=UPI0027358A58|nr:TAXI family TRAP transporter solute-binding subunit [Methylobacterium sp. NEAU 140]MDP4021891.1 TAXI family TRAP transporter solute-binding subunit [Methylobacterium sp. NEAU 140]